jgi:hypothetical protein
MSSNNVLPAARQKLGPRRRSTARLESDRGDMILPHCRWIDSLHRIGAAHSLATSPYLTKRSARAVRTGILQELWRSSAGFGGAARHSDRAVQATGAGAKWTKPHAYLN